MKGQRSSCYCVQEMKNPPLPASERIKPPRAAVKSTGVLRANTHSLLGKTLIFACEMKTRKVSRKLVNVSVLLSDALSAHQGRQQLKSNLHTISLTDSPSMSYFGELGHPLPV